jgi:hypothetical protein
VRKDLDSLFEEIEPYRTLQARVGNGFFHAVENEAGKRKQSVSEFVRDCVGLQLLGDILKKKASRLSEGEREIAKAYKLQLEKLNRGLIEGIKHQQLVERAEGRARERLKKSEVIQRIVDEAIETLFTKPLKKRIQ